jgi:hypothetical protein
MSNKIKKLIKESNRKVDEVTKKIDKIVGVKKAQSTIIHYALGGLLLLILAVAAIVAYSKPQAESISTQTEITNASSTIDSVFISNSANGGVDDYFSGTIVPVAGDVKTLHINGVVRDTNGTEDIATTSLVFYRSSVGGGASCSADNNNCYRVPVCVLTPDTSTTKKFDCQIDLQYYADSTDTGGRFSDDNWVAYVQVWDQSEAGSINNSVTKEVGTVLSLTIPTAISYGNSFSLGQETINTDNQEMVITQNGNDEADVQVSGTNMTCSSIGAIPVGNQKWSLSDVGYNGSSTPLTAISDNTFLNVGYRDNDASPVTKSLYWNIGIPATGVKGDCVGSNTITTIAHVNEGYLLDGPVKNVKYTSPSFGVRYTDNNGRFIYATGETVAFRIGSTTIGDIGSTSKPVPSDGKVTIPDLVGVSRDDILNPQVIKIARFILSLDDGSNPDGINISDAVRDKLNNMAPLNMQTAIESDIQAVLTTINNDVDIHLPTPLTLVSEGFAQDHISDTYLGVIGGSKMTGYAWGDKTGWVSFDCSNTTHGCDNASYGVVQENSNVLSGYAWGEQTGWISFKGTNYGVLVGTSTLSGYAWGEQTGWISFTCANDNSCDTNNYGVTMDPVTGALDGYAWSEQTGYIHMKGTAADNTNYGAILNQ